MSDLFLARFTTAPHHQHTEEHRSLDDIDCLSPRPRHSRAGIAIIITVRAVYRFGTSLRRGKTRASPSR